MKPLSWTSGAWVLVFILGLTGLSCVTQITSSNRPLASAPRPLTSREPDAATKAKVQVTYSKLPLSFEANQGQTDGQVHFLSRGRGYTLFLTSTEAVLALRKPARHDAETRGHGDTETFTASPTRPVAVSQSPPTPDLQPNKSSLAPASGERGPVPSVFVPSPLAGEGQDGGRSRSPLRIDDNGDLILHTQGGEIRLHKPRIYQEINGVKQPIPGGYVLLSPQSSSLVTFQVAAYDESKPLIIDPVLSYSTYLGGSADELSLDIAIDSSGNAYVTGDTSSTDFPTASPIQAAFGGGFSDAFVAKIVEEASTWIRFPLEGDWAPITQRVGDWYPEPYCGYHLSGKKAGLWRWAPSAFWHPQGGV